VVHEESRCHRRRHFRSGSRVSPAAAIGSTSSSRSTVSAVDLDQGRQSPAQRLGQHHDWHVALNGARLVREINSVRRRNRIAKEIARRFGQTATLVETKVTDVMKELETRRAHREARHETATSRSPTRERTPELEALEAELARKHWDAWIDTNVPALGNRTPRQAAKTARGRERLAALLADFARTAGRSPTSTRPDLEALRRTLGLD
jgi:hypothetical protein